MKKLNLTREQALRWVAQGMMAILILVADAKPAAAPAALPAAGKK